jgi:hypothetical protein
MPDKFPPVSPSRTAITLVGACLVWTCSFAVYSEAVIAQVGERADAFVAFRADDSHVIAVVNVVDLDRQQKREAVSGPPIAQYGFRYYPADHLSDYVPAAIRPQQRWSVHGGRRAFQATAEGIVAGSVGCQDIVGMLMAIDPDARDEFKKMRARYFVAGPPISPAVSTGGPAGVGAVISNLTSAQISTLESLLNDLLKRDLPRVLADSEPGLARNESADRRSRSWAAEWRRINAALSAGRAKLSFDTQAFRLDPSGTPMYFVRAQWRVGTRQVFAASLWLRGDRLESVAVDTWASSALRMWEFQGEISRDQLGIVLNVVDSDRDGWGEVIVGNAGYEGISIEVLEYSPTGFGPTGISYAFGC